MTPPFLISTFRDIGIKHPISRLQPTTEETDTGKEKDLIMGDEVEQLTAEIDDISGDTKTKGGLR